MIVSLSRRELAQAWRCLALGSNWGGSEDIMLAQGELWMKCRLGEIKPLTAIEDGVETPTMLDVGALAPELEQYDLSANALSLLRNCFSVKGQELLFALNSLQALTRIRATVAEQAPK